MTTKLEYIDENVNKLTLSGITLLDLDDVSSWLHALDVPHTESRSICRNILTDGIHTMSNIEHRLTVLFKQ